MFNIFSHLLAAKGLKSTWDQLGNISAAIDYLKKVKKKVTTTMNSTYQSTTHTKPDTTHLIWRITEKAQAEVFEKFIKNQAGNLRIITNSNVVRSGEKKLKSSSITSFNKKIMAMKSGQSFYALELKMDTLPKPAYGTTSKDSGE